MTPETTTTNTNPYRGISSTGAGPTESCGFICARLAPLFNVRTHEVGVLAVTGSVLEFVYPHELRRVSSIPLNSSAVAAQVARSNHAELWNDFAAVRHWDIFETVYLDGAEDPAALVIQKLMTAPVSSPVTDEVIGVVQICRKGPTPDVAGPDFTREDLERLIQATSEVGLALPLLRYAGHLPGLGRPSPNPPGHRSAP